MTATRRDAPPMAPLTAEHEAHRRQVDGRAREMHCDLPLSVAVQLDEWLRLHLVRDDELPHATSDLCKLVTHRAWIIDALKWLVGAGMIERADVRSMSWEGREHVARLAIVAGDDLAADVAQLRAELEQGDV